MALAQVRLATPEDAAEIARIQRVVWTTAYTDMLPPGVVEEFDEEAAALTWETSIHRLGPSEGLWVATEGDAVVGYAAAGSATADDLTDATGTVAEDAGWVGAIETLLVEPRWGRRGHGGRLMVEAAATLRSTGYRRGIAWVPERDAASRRFYARAGWEPDGTLRVLDAGGRPLRELRLTGPVDLEYAPEPTAEELGLPLLE